MIGSDLDIICEVHDPAEFKALLSRYFGDMDEFASVTWVVQGIPRTKINFITGGWPIELFGQPRPTVLQNGYLHMIVEAEILLIHKIRNDNTNLTNTTMITMSVCHIKCYGELLLLVQYTV